MACLWAASKNFDTNNGQAFEIDCRMEDTTSTKYRQCVGRHQHCESVRFVRSPQCLAFHGKLTATDMSVVKLMDQGWDTGLATNTNGELNEKKLNSRGHPSALLLQTRGLVVTDPCELCSKSIPFQSRVVAATYQGKGLMNGRLEILAAGLAYTLVLS
ncbi:hypothetical protein Aspvir_010075 [Aspergillus viridinutans]|uniref:Uncharacterized protein n=1 Tax=Aspergillus viridinutans TaxID=75553 RepID=A0A9P3C1A4_ASPVI|nr:uncharacterized protein Aspvir_010075 [Aspergillus viridinutans]GIK05959.1 hypothetical protein Aspvir_010075 [Aspergillus viridinutans]